MTETKFKFSEKSHKQRKMQCYIPKRYIVALLGFLGMFNVYALRVNLSVAMVAMINNTEDSSSNKTNLVHECPMLITELNDAEDEGFKGDQYNWDSKTQANILGAFFYGYILTQVPGGLFAEKYGAKWLYGGGVLVTAIFSLLTPLAARWGVGAFLAVRVIEGFGEGVTFPAMNIIVSHWAPKMERSRVSTIVYTGAQIGNVVAMPISGWLSGTDLLGGWPSVFYVFGTVGCIWFLFWSYLIYETPAEHPTISLDEMKLFEELNDEIHKEKPRTPWKSIFTSLPMWAVIVAHFGQNFGFLILLTELPTYLSSILHFNITTDGALSAVPYILQAVSAWMASFVADRLRKSKKMSNTTIRRVCNSIGLFGPAVCLLGVTMSGCRADVIVTLISLAMAFNGFIYSGYNVTHVDMSPDFAGTLFGITNAISNTCGVIGPAVVGAFTASGATISNWSNVFYVTAAVYTVSAVFYAVFASGELQPWASGDNAKQKPTTHIDMKDQKS